MFNHIARSMLPLCVFPSVTARGGMDSKTCKPPIAKHTKAAVRGGMGSKTCKLPSLHTARRHAKNLYKRMEAHVWPRCRRKLGGLNQSLTVHGLDKDMIPLKTLGRRLTDKGIAHTGEGNIELMWQPREGHKCCTSYK